MQNLFGTITISFFFTLWSAGKGFFALCKGLNAAYGIEENIIRKIRLRALVSTFIFILFIVSSFILLVFGNNLYLFLQEKFQLTNYLTTFILKFRFFISIIFFTLIFVGMYRFIPKHKCSLKKQWKGAILASIACNLLSGFYAIYVDVFKGFSVIYGSLTSIILTMIWVYGCMYSILLGAIINKMAQKKE